jgi:hypothetical protein
MRAADVAKDRRSEVRYATEQMSKLTIVGTSSTMPAVICDVSRNGMQLTIGQPLGVGVSLKIELISVSADVEVKYCQPDGPGRYRVGVLTRDIQSVSGLQTHLAQDLMAFYAIGRGLVPSESMEVQAHLRTCTQCREGVGEMESILYPTMAHPGLRQYLMPPAA